MGMIGYLLRIKSSELEEILDNSSLLEDKIDTAMLEQNSALADLDKSWEALYYLLTGYGLSNIDRAQAPLSWTIFSGQEVDPEQDLGYGPGFYVTPEQVKQVDEALQQISDNEMIGRFDGNKMNRQAIYPEIWDEPDSLDYILEYFKTLKLCYRQAAENSEAVIAFIS